jgi:sphingolipid delta-4 desaturase
MNTIITENHHITKEDNDFYWDTQKEPHVVRREQILENHPEVTKLYGINPMMKYTTTLLVIAQVAVAIGLNLFSADIPYFWVVFVAASYLIGATITHALFLAIHEITHDLAFKTKWHNNILAYVANIPLLFPYAMGFKTYHSMHHWEQGKDGVDTDIPTETEAKIFRGFIGKIFFFLFQILFYALRPVFVKTIKFSKWHYWNIVTQVVAMAIIIPFAGWIGVLYFLLSLVLAGSLHPTSGHFISEHYVFHEGQETYSYYGPLNAITFNVGYHNEHHDFPRIPGSRLPALKKIAPEYYDNLHSYKSWTGVILKFLFDKKVTLYSRTKRK